MTYNPQNFMRFVKTVKKIELPKEFSKVDNNQHLFNLFYYNPLMKNCFHCGLTLSGPEFSCDQHVFCCQGCLSVYDFLKSMNELKFYDLLNLSPNPQKLFFSTNRHFADPQALTAPRVFKLKSPNIRCAACAYIIEKLTSFNPKIQSAHVNVVEATITLQLDKGITLDEVAEYLRHMGYPVEIFDGKETNQHQNFLIALALSFASMIATMHLSLSFNFSNSSVEKKYLLLFGLMNFIVLLPGLYVQKSLLQRTISGIIQKRFALDFTLCLGIFIGLGLSIYNISILHPVFYFDTIAMIFFLLVLSQYIQWNMWNQLKIPEVDQIRPNTANLRHQGGVTRVSVDEIKVGDEIEVLPGEKIPVDGTVISESCTVDASTITGESEELTYTKGAHVLAGCLNLYSLLRISTTRSGDDCLFQQWTKKSKEQSHYYQYPTIEYIAKFYLPVLIIVSGFFFGLNFLRNGNFENALITSMEIFLVSCPCAFLIASPFAAAGFIRAASNRGIILKSPNVLEKLNQIKFFIFDKTGTLTKKSVTINWLTSKGRFESLLKSLVFYSHHPISKTILENLPNNVPTHKIEMKEILHSGITGIFEGVSVQLIHENKKLLFSVDGNAVAEIITKDTPLMSQKDWQTLNKPKILLSGDGEEKVIELKNQFEFVQTFHSQSPQEKEKLMDRFEDALFVGDGLNDAAAMKKAKLSFAASGGIVSSLQSADGYFINSGIAGLLQLLNLRKRFIRVLTISLTVSLIYNIIAIYLIEMNVLPARICAIGMPISSLIVAMISFGGFRWKQISY